jgi:hypothetical protein
MLTLPVALTPNRVERQGRSSAHLEMRLGFGWPRIPRPSAGCSARIAFILLPCLVLVVIRALEPQDSVAAGSQRRQLSNCGTKGSKLVVDSPA